MKPGISLAGITGAFLLAAGALLTASESWKLPARLLPLPAGASPQVRATLAALPVPDPARARRLRPEDPEAWRRLIESGRAERERQARHLAHRFGVRVRQDALAGVPVYTLHPGRTAPGRAGGLFVHLHGGAYVFNGGLASTLEGVLIAARTGIPVLSIDYRMPPEHPFPAALEDVVKVWRALLEQRAAESMALGGTSAGAGLALAAVHRFRTLELPPPGVVFAGTPWSDLTKTGDSYFLNEGADHLLMTADGFLEAAARLYAGGRDLRDPLLSPVYGDFTGFPPTLLVTGTRDLFLSNTVRVHQKLRAAGVEARLHVYEGFAHGDYLFMIEAPESRAVFRELDAFLREHLDGRGATGPEAGTAGGTHAD